MARVFLNPHVGRSPAFEAPSRAPLDFHRRLPGYRATPLRVLPGLAELLGVGCVLVKDETSRLGLPAFKILGASWATYRTAVERLGRELSPRLTLREMRAEFEELLPLELVTATDGNHGRGVARVATLFGFDAHVFVPQGTARARIAGIESEGATVTVVAGSYDETVEEAARYADRDTALLVQDTSWIGYQEIPGRIIEGYSTLFWEIEDALAAGQLPAPTHVVVPIGVGSLAAAAVQHYGGREVPPHLIGVEPLSAACGLLSAERDELVSVPGPHTSVMAGLNCGTLATLAWPLMRRGMHAFIAMDDVCVPDALRALRTAGIIAGESGASGLAALLDLLGNADADEQRAKLGLDETACVLLLCTEGPTDPETYARLVGV